MLRYEVSLDTASGADLLQRGSGEALATRSMTIAIVSFAAIQLAGGFGTMSALVAQPPLALNQGTWTNSGSRTVDLQGETSPALPHQRVALTEYASTAEGVHRLRELSGLTWDQVAKVFGVSRRAVHLWAAGRQMNAGHEELLAQVIRVVAALPEDSQGLRRSALLGPHEDGPSIYDQLRMDRANAQVLAQSSFVHIAAEAIE